MINPIRQKELHPTGRTVNVDRERNCVVLFFGNHERFRFNVETFYLAALELRRHRAWLPTGLRGYLPDCLNPRQSDFIHGSLLPALLQ
jgi:hypothetical protein